MHTKLFALSALLLASCLGTTHQKGNGGGRAASEGAGDHSGGARTIGGNASSYGGTGVDGVSTVGRAGGDHGSGGAGGYDGEARGERGEETRARGYNEGRGGKGAAGFRGGRDDGGGGGGSEQEQITNGFTKGYQRREDGAHGDTGDNGGFKSGGSFQKGGFPDNPGTFPNPGSYTKGGGGGSFITIRRKNGGQRGDKGYINGGENGGPDVRQRNYKGEDYNENANYPPQPYQFDYNVQDELGNTNYRQEQGDGNGNVKGSYGYTDVDGVYRIVEYEADANGFRAIIRTNEPGVGPESPADVVMNVEPPPQAVVDKYAQSGRGGGYGGDDGGGGRGDVHGDNCPNCKIRLQGGAYDGAAGAGRSGR